jgi:hypothetical protein
MAAQTMSEGSGWASRHPQMVGVFILLALHLVFVVGPLAVSSLPSALQRPYFTNWLWIGEWTGFKHEAVPFLIGIVQLYYVVPAVLLALKLRYPAVAKGIAHAALATFLLNAAGCGFFLWQLSKING